MDSKDNKWWGFVFLFVLLGLAWTMKIVKQEYEADKAKKVLQQARMHQPLRKDMQALMRADSVGEQRSLKNKPSARSASFINGLQQSAPYGSVEAEKQPK